MTESMTKKQEGENTMKNELTTEQAKKLLTAIFSESGDEMPDDNYPDTDREKGGVFGVCAYPQLAVYRQGQYHRLNPLAQSCLRCQEPA